MFIPRVLITVLAVFLLTYPAYSGSAPDQLVVRYQIFKMTCGNYVDFTDYLSRTHGEYRAKLGQLNGALTHELWVSPTGTYSILQCMPHGAVCMLGSGDDWEKDNGV